LPSDGVEAKVVWRGSRKTEESFGAGVKITVVGIKRKSKIIIPSWKLRKYPPKLTRKETLK